MSEVKLLCVHVRTVLCDPPLTPICRSTQLQGPVAKGTRAESVRLHDAKKLYTGTHKVGGPSTIDHKITLSNLTDRTQADARGVKLIDKAKLTAKERMRSKSKESITQHKSKSYKSPVRKGALAASSM